MVTNKSFVNACLARYVRAKPHMHGETVAKISMSKEKLESNITPISLADLAGFVIKTM